MAWCERFVAAYRGTPVDRLWEHYGRASVLVVVTAGDGRWTEPVSGARAVAARLAELCPAVNGWPVVSCQRARPDALVVAMRRGPAGDRQILVVRRREAAAGGAVVRDHFYVAAAAVAAAAAAASQPQPQPPPQPSSFPGRFERWAASLDRAALRRHRVALRAVLSVLRGCYAPADRASRWRHYDAAARFSCTVDGAGGARVSVGPGAISERYARLARDHRLAGSRAVEACWSAAPGAAVSVLLVGVAPRAPRRRIVQFLVVDTRTRKIVNDVLSVDDAAAGPRPRSCSSRSSSSSLSPWSSSGTVGSSASASASDAECASAARGDDGRRPDAAEPAQLRARLTAHALKARQGGAGAEAAAPAAGLNPRQLFIGCVPLHVKYGQLKLLFEQFGEVTYVKVYESYSKQTGAKMMHNYAFLFFKNEASVDRAIAASPVQLDSNWHLNVSRPLRHAAPAVVGR